MEKNLLLKYFIGWCDRVAQDKFWTKDESKVDIDSAIHQHLIGSKRLGCSPFITRPSNLIKWACLEVEGHGPGAVDGDIKSVVKKAYLYLLRRKITTYIESSKSDDAYHIWIFFDKDGVEAKRVTTYLKNNVEKMGLPKETEIFPKQSFLNPSACGNYVNLPFFDDYKKTGKTQFLDLNLKPIEIESFTTIDQKIFPIVRTASIDVESNSDKVSKTYEGGKEVVSICHFCRHVMDGGCTREELIAFASTIKFFDGGNAIIHDAVRSFCLGRGKEYNPTQAQSQIDSTNAPWGCEKIREISDACPDYCYCSSVFKLANIIKKGNIIYGYGH